MKIGTRNVNGVKMAKMNSISVGMDFDRAYVKLDNLFNGDKAIGIVYYCVYSVYCIKLYNFVLSSGEAVNSAINANVKTLAKDIAPLVIKALNREFRKSCDQIIRLYKYDTLFPE